MSVEISDELQARREELNAQLCALQSQHANITRELQLAEADRRAAIADGQDVTILTEHLRHRQIGLQETSWAIEEIRGQLAQTDAEVRRRAPYQALDRDLKQLVIDLHAYDEDRAHLDGAYQAAIDKVANIAKELHDLVWTARQRHDDLEVRARKLRATARRLHYLNLAVPTPRSWKEPIEQALRGTGAAWRAYLTSIQNRAPEPFARELGAAAAIALVTHRQAMRRMQLSPAQHGHPRGCGEPEAHHDVGQRQPTPQVRCSLGDVDGEPYRVSYVPPVEEDGATRRTLHKVTSTSESQRVT